MPQIILFASIQHIKSTTATFQQSQRVFSAFKLDPTANENVIAMLPKQITESPTNLPTNIAYNVYTPKLFLPAFKRREL